MSIRPSATVLALALLAGCAALSPNAGTPAAVALPPQASAPAAVATPADDNLNALALRLGQMQARAMLVDALGQRSDWLDRLEADARADDERSRTILVFVARALDQLRSLGEPPARDAELATLRWVRQPKEKP